jgi:hypothetical protein
MGGRAGELSEFFDADGVRVVVCGACRRRFQAPGARTGQHLLCPGCDRPVVVDAPVARAKRWHRGHRHAGSLRIADFLSPTPGEGDRGVLLFVVFLLLVIGAVGSLLWGSFGTDLDPEKHILTDVPEFDSPK